MAKLTIKNLDKVIENIDESKKLLDVLREEEVYVKSSCGGHASCTDCVIKIFSGEDHLTPPPFEEINLLGNVFHITKERLACQTKITGDVTIDLSAHVQKDDEEKLRNKTSKKNPIRVRKSEEVSKMYDERKKKVEEKKKERDAKEESYYKHWEKGPQDPNEIPRPKRLGGGRRPRPFKTPEKDPENSEND